LQAPSGSNRQGWHWAVITDENLRRLIGDYYRKAVDSYLKSPGAAAAPFADDPKRNAVQRRIGESVAYLGEHMGEVPVLVIACIHAPSLRAGNQAGLWGSLLPAAWSYMLAARARGLGAAWTTLHLRYEKEISEVIGIPPDIRQGVLIPTAYYTGDTFQRAPRQPLDTVFHLNTW
jgi:nitroreductase